MSDLTKQQEVFVTEYIRLLDAGEAAIRAGYKKHRAKLQGEILLKKDYILEAIKEAIFTQAQSLQVSKAYIVQRLLNIIEFSTAQEDILDKDGNKTGKTKLRDTQSSLRALDFLCKHLGMAQSECGMASDDPQITIIDNLNEKRI